MPTSQLWHQRTCLLLSSNSEVRLHKCLIRVGISVTFCLTSHPSRGPTNTGEQASRNKMFTFIKSTVVSRISLIFTGKNKRFWEFPKRVEMLKNG